MFILIIIKQDELCLMLFWNFLLSHGSCSGIINQVIINKFRCVTRLTGASPIKSKIILLSQKACLDHKSFTFTNNNDYSMYITRFPPVCICNADY